MNGRGAYPFLSSWWQGYTLELRKATQLGDANDAEAVALNQWFWGQELTLSADSGGYNLTGNDATLTKVSTTGYPAPSDVRDGVVYGPGGIFTGTLVATSGETSVAIRSFTRKF